MASIGLVEGATSLNPTQQAFDRRGAQLDQKRAQEAQAGQAEQDRKDNDMLQVFKYAGDGFIDEARYVAKSKNLQVPEEIFSNADFAKGLGLAGELYGEDKAGAQKFATAWAQTQGDVQDRIIAASQAAGAPQDRLLQRQIAVEQWKKDNGIGGGATPAAIQVGSKMDELYWKARDPNLSPEERTRADMAYNHLRQGGKLDDKGIRYNLYQPSAQNYTPSDPLQSQTQQTSQDPLEASRNAIQQANAQGIRNPYQTMPNTPLPIEQGNINLNDRPVVGNSDGSISTIKSISVNINGKEVLIPTISPDGAQLTEQQAIDRYRQTGEHLGVFDTPEQATAFAKQLSERQGQTYAQPPVTITPQPGYGQAVGTNAAAVAGMEQQAKKDVDLNMNPQIEAAESRAVYMEEGLQGLPKAQRLLQSQELREEFLAPKFQSIRERANGLTTDWGGALLGVFPGSAAYDLRRDVDTLLANAGFDRLQEMRNNSPTGGALGQVSEIELQLLQAAAQSLMASQSREQFLRNLQTFEQQRLRSLENVRRAYEQDYQRFGGQMDPYLPAPQMSQQQVPGVQSPQIVSQREFQNEPATPVIQSPNDPAFQQLPSGSQFRTPDGQIRIKK